MVDLVKRDNKLYVMKLVVNTGPKKTKGGHVQEAVKEARILKSLEHPNIVEFKEAFVEKKYLCLVMAYCDSGDLKARIQRAAKRRKLFKEQTIMDWFVQMALALHYMHARKILHRDIKPQNIFLTESNKIVKLGDFGVTLELNATLEMARTQVGTPYYMSPELAHNKPYNNKSDVWAIGCVLSEMCTLGVPFEARSFGELAMKILKKKPRTIQRCYSTELRELVKAMLQKNPNRRPTMGQVLKSPYVVSCLKSFVERHSEFEKAAAPHTSRGVASKAASTASKSSPTRGPVIGLLQRQKELEADLQRARERIAATRELQRKADEAKEARKKEELNGTLKKLEEEQFVKVKEKHKIDGKLEEDAALREVVRMCNTIAREVALSSSGSELIRSGLESPQRQKPPSTRHRDQRKIKHLSRSGQQLIKSINSNLNAMPSVNPILAAAKNMASPDTPSKYRAMGAKHEPTPRRKTANKLEAINRPVTSDLENTKREPHPVFSESRPHTTQDITSTSNFLAGVDQKLLQEASSMARQLDSRGKVMSGSSRGADGRRLPSRGRLTPMIKRK